MDRRGELVSKTEDQGQGTRSGSHSRKPLRNLRSKDRLPSAILFVLMIFETGESHTIYNCRPGQLVHPSSPQCARLTKCRELEQGIEKAHHPGAGSGRLIRPFFLIARILLQADGRMRILCWGRSSVGCHCHKAPARLKVVFVGYLQCDMTSEPCPIRRVRCRELSLEI